MASLSEMYDVGWEGKKTFYVFLRSGMLLYAF